MMKIRMKLDGATMTVTCCHLSITLINNIYVTHDPINSLIIDKTYVLTALLRSNIEVFSTFLLINAIYFFTGSSKSHGKEQKLNDNKAVCLSAVQLAPP